MTMNPKDRSMICRIAGNIAGPIAVTVLQDYAVDNEVVPNNFPNQIAKRAIEIAFAIVYNVDKEFEEYAMQKEAAE